MSQEGDATTAPQQTTHTPATANFGTPESKSLEVSASPTQRRRSSGTLPSFPAGLAPSAVPATTTTSPSITPSTSPLPGSERTGPRASKLAQNIASLTERTRAAREELARMCNITRELKEQCAIQEKECEDLEADQSRAKGDVDALMKRIEILAGEKIVVQQKLEELKAENARLDAFLQTAKGGGPPIMEEAAAEKPAAATA